MAADIAERNSIKLTEARELLAAVDLDAPSPVAPSLYADSSQQESRQR